jgi:SNF2 family DNA or RNA helicase
MNPDVGNSLYPFQEEGIRFLLNHPRALLADDMGLGKTVQVASALERLLNQKAIKRALIVSPVSLCQNWSSELNSWCKVARPVLYEGSERYGLLEGNAKIIISSYESIASDLKTATVSGERFCDIGVDLIVLDEAQKIKSPESMRSKIIAKILAPHRWALTGTPLENTPREFASILRFLEPNEFSESARLDDYAYLFKLRDQFMIRRLKDEVGLQLPSKSVKYLPVRMSPSQASEYSYVLEETLDLIKSPSEVKKFSSGHLLAKLQSLRRLSSISTTQDSSKIDLLEDELPSLVERGSKVVLFSSFPHLIFPEILKRLKHLGVVCFTGKMSKDDRIEAHQRFLSDPAVAVMCASVQAAGTGLTWTVAAYAYFLDLWWNPMVLKQAEDRIYRLGQKENVLIKRIISEGTIEEGIRQLLEKKLEIFDLMINDKIITKPSVRDIDDLTAWLLNGARR